MKRTVPVAITAIVGFVLIISVFIPATKSWGKEAAVWFDVLAAIAFVLGGGSLLKMHLKKISDRAAGWGYSGVTLIAFIATLVIGLGKFGAPPASKQEYYGETFAPLSLADFPESQITSIDGQLPDQPDHLELPPSVRRQLKEVDGKLQFRGWMLPDQKTDLLNYEDELKWQCTVETLFSEAQPDDGLKGKAAYYSDHEVLVFKGAMQDSQRDLLLAIDSRPTWQDAVERLYEQSRRETRIEVGKLPTGVQIPEPMSDVLTHIPESGELVMRGPMSRSQLTGLELRGSVFPLARPLNGKKREQFRRELEKLGNPLTKKQEQQFDKLFDGTWSVKQIRSVLDEAGKPAEVTKTACEMLAEQLAGTAVEPKKSVGTTVTLNDEQVAVLQQFAENDSMTVGQLAEQLKVAGTFEDRQQAALENFFSTVPTRGERNYTLYFELLRRDRQTKLTTAQTNFLLEEYRRQFNWRQTIGEIFVASHVAKYKWSGDYAAQGTAFWWVYEYLFKPLTATMFAMLAFYVASAAFRAFRAKNVEATLLLGTAFIILLGRTFAGVQLTSWMPDSLAGLRFENLSVYIMQVFNTAGNRAIMIGIALGIASTSLKVLLGVDRSYLGSADE